MLLCNISHLFIYLFGQISDGPDIKTSLICKEDMVSKLKSTLRASFLFKHNPDNAVTEYPLTILLMKHIFLLKDKFKFGFKAFWLCLKPLLFFFFSFLQRGDDHQKIAKYCLPQKSVVETSHEYLTEISRVHIAIPLQLRLCIWHAAETSIAGTKEKD